MSVVLDDDTSTTLEVMAHFSGRGPLAQLQPPAHPRLSAALWQQTPRVRRLSGIQRHILTIVLRGDAKVKMVVGGRCVWSGPAAGAAVLLRAGDETEWHFDGNMEQLQIYLDLEEDIAQQMTACLNRPFRDTALLRLAQSAALAAREGYATSGFIGPLLEALQQGLVERHSGGVAPDAPLRAEGGLSGRMQAQIEALVHERLSERISVQELAAAVQFSPGHFNRAFRQSFGMSPIQYLTDQRIARAMRLLRDTRIPIAAVASATGFSSASHLGSVFRRETGQSPREYRRA